VTLALLAVVAVALVLLGAVAAASRRERAAAREAGARAEVSAREAADAERRRREALNDLPFMALRVDGACRLLEANRAAVARFPFLSPGMGLLEAFSEHSLPRRVQDAIDALEPARFEVRLFAGGRHTYRVDAEPYEVGGAREALLFLSDATEEADYQELRSQFVANVSHELRTPLTGLRALLETLDDEGMDAATRRDFVGRAAREAERLEALIGDILFLSELEAGPGRPSDDRSDLAAAAAATSRELGELAAEQRVRLEVEAPEPAWAPLTDRMAGTVVRNLVENAVKYAGQGATARTVVRREGGSIVLEVADDGAGIPERHLPHVFERFYRADPSRSKRLGGTGLGLSIVKHIAERSGGTAEAASREGFGTTITVTVPAAEGPAPGP
jgi:two-component system phosphate regulon sensor histidine kinase PhoR